MGPPQFAVCFLAFLAFGQAQNWNFQASQRGRSCTTPNSRPGRCNPIQECEPLLAILREPPLSNQALQFMRQSQCGYQGRSPLVCCTNDNTNYPDPSNPWFVPVPTTPTPTRPPTRATPRPTPSSIVGPAGGNRPNSVENHPNRALLPIRECGQDFSQRIFGGNITDLDEFPWTALLRYRARDGKEKLLCGGVLISKRYVLSAAHCSNKGQLRGNRLFGVRLGEYDTSKDPDCEQTITGEQLCANPPINYEIEQEIVHPEYLGTSANQHHDIALLRLNSDVTFNTDYIKPVCLPTAREVLNRAYVGQDLTVTGWGRTETRSSSPIKLKVKVPVVDNAQCAQIYAGKNRQVIGRQICAGGIRGQDSCSGDSGGPLLSAEKLTTDQQLRYHVTGIVSYGPDPCGEAGWPGVYTRVAEYSGWILDQMRP